MATLRIGSLALACTLAAACTASEATGGAVTATASGGAAAPASAGPAAPATTSGGGTSPAAAAPCSAAGAFCWLNPLPQGSTLAGLWLASEVEGWAVGPPGAVLRWDGATFAPQPVPSAAPLRAAWGSARDDVWAAGDALLHYDGQAWSAAPGAPAGAWYGVHGSSRADVWLVGAGGAVAHFDGASWSPRPIPTADDLSAVAVVSASEVYVATAHGGTVLRWDGTAWAIAARLASRALSSLLAVAPGEVWAAGEPLDVNAAAGARGTALAHLSGGAWSSVVVPGLETATFTAVQGGAAAGVWAAATTGAGEGRVAHLVGGTWTVEAPPPPALALRAVQVAGGLVLAVGDGGQAFSRRGGTWTAVHHGVPGYLQSASASPAGDVWFGAIPAEPDAALPQAQLLRVSDGAVEAVPIGVDDVVYGVWATSPSDVWVGTLRSGLVHFDGASWTPRVGGYAGLADGVWASGPTDVWAVAGAYAVHWDGASVTRHALPGGGARRVFGVAPDDVWAVGGAGVVQHWDGATWSALPFPGGPAWGVWGAAADDLWFVGDAGLAVHWDGRSFSRVDTGTTATLWAVRGAGATDLWVAGARGTVLHGDGRGFTPVASGTDNALAAVAIGPGGDVYVAGDFGSILRRARP